MSAGNSVSLKGKTSFSKGKVELTFSNIVWSTIGIDAEEERGDEEEEGENGVEEVEEVLIWSVVVAVVAIVLTMLDVAGWISPHRHTQHVKFKFAVLDKAIN